MPKTQKKIYRTAIIGLGKIASRYQEDQRRHGIVTHAAAYWAHPQCRLVAGYDPDPSQRTRFSKRWKGVVVYSHLQKLLKETRPEIVSVCTPPKNHASLLKKLLKEKPLGIFCEKPMARNYAEALEISRLMKTSPTRLSLNVSRRWDPMHQRLSNDLRRQRWGKIQTVDAYYTDSLQSTGAHLIDGLRMLVGEISWAQALPPFSKNAKQGMNAILGFKKGVLAFLHHLDRSHYLIYEMDIYCSRGRLRLTDNGFRTEVWKVGPSPQFQKFKALQRSASPYGPGYDRVMERAVDDLIQAVGNGHDPLCTFKEGLASLSVQEALLISSQQKGRRIFLRGKP